MRSKTPANNFEAIFDEFIVWFGGEIVTNLFDETHELPNNADYLLFERTVVAELKCLQKEYYNNKEIGEKFKKQINEWLCQKRIPKSDIKGNLIDIPKNLAPKVVDVFAAPLKKAVKKANKQIKATKEYFNIPNAKGLLIMTNEKNSSLYPELAFHILGRLFKKEYSSIDSFIYLLPCMRVVSPNMPIPLNFWASGSTRDDSIGVSSDKLNLVEVKWRKFLEEKYRCKIHDIVENDHSIIKDLKIFRK